MGGTGITGYEHRTTPESGVNPVNEIQFGICTSGRSVSDVATSIQTTIVLDAESLGISFDGNIEEWNPMDQAGWTRRLMTSKSLTVSMGGKRHYGDVGNDYVASLALKTGQDCNSWLAIIFPNMDKLIIPVVINVTSMGGDSTSIDTLEWEAQSDGKPTYVSYTAPGSGE